MRSRVILLHIRMIMKINCCLFQGIFVWMYQQSIHSISWKMLHFFFWCTATDGWWLILTFHVHRQLSYWHFMQHLCTNLTVVNGYVEYRIFIGVSNNSTRFYFLLNHLYRNCAVVQLDYLKLTCSPNYLRRDGNLEIQYRCKAKYSEK